MATKKTTRKKKAPSKAPASEADSTTRSSYDPNRAYLQNIYLGADYFNQIKNEAKRRTNEERAARRHTRIKRPKVRIQDVMDEALEWFMNTQAAQGYRHYFAATKKDKLRQFFLTGHVAERANDMGARDGVPQARVVYTAIVLYCESHLTAKSRLL